MMLPERCLDAYEAQYPKDFFGYEECLAGNLVINRHGTLKSYMQPEDETEETFMDRLERSKKAGRNLFYEEWERFRINPFVIY